MKIGKSQTPKQSTEEIKPNTTEIKHAPVNPTIFKYKINTKD